MVYLNFCTHELFVSFHRISDKDSPYLQIQSIYLIVFVDNSCIARDQLLVLGAPVFDSSV